eukprot:15329605-Ditylum_brightwellii.AAC.1
MQAFDEKPDKPTHTDNATTATMEVDNDWDDNIQWEGETDAAGSADSAVQVWGTNNDILLQQTFTNVMAKGKTMPQKEGWQEQENPMATSIGKLMEPWGIANSYTHTQRLSHWSQEGVEVDCGPHWSKATVLAAVTRGLHTSALTPEAINLVHEDIAYQVKAGFCQ